MLSSMCECYVFLNIFFYYFTIQAILLESPTRQLTLGDIYKWFTTNFKYFRTTSNLTWKVKIHTNVCFLFLSHCTGCTSSKMISEISFFVLSHPVRISRYFSASVGHYHSVFFIQVTVAPCIFETHSHNLE